MDRSRSRTRIPVYVKVIGIIAARPGVRLFRTGAREVSEQLPRRPNDGMALPSDRGPREPRLARGRSRKQLDPYPVGVLDECEEGAALHERRDAGPRALVDQLAIRGLDVVACERDVIEFVAVPVGAFEERGSLGIPVQLERLRGPLTLQLGPFAFRLLDRLPSSNRHAEAVPVERDRGVHVPHLDPDVREGVPHADRTRKRGTRDKDIAGGDRRVTLLSWTALRGRGGADDPDR